MQVSVTYYQIISDLDTYLLETFLSNMIKHFKHVACKDKIHLVEQFTFGESFLFSTEWITELWMCGYVCKNQSGVCDVYAAKEQHGNSLRRVLRRGGAEGQLRD